MQKIKVLILIALLVCATFTITARAEDIAGCHAVYQVPEGQPFSSKIVRPPFWEMNRWECLATGLGYTTFEASPANGTDTDFQLALVFETAPEATAYYPILFVNEDWLHVYTFGVGQIERYDWTLDQGTGIITLATAPAQGEQVYFELYAP